MSALRVRGIPASLRKNAHSRGVRDAALEVASAGVMLEIADLRGFPVFN